MKKLVVFIAVLLVACSIATADDLNPPPWSRDNPHSSFQLWEFFTDDTSPAPDALDNPFGDPVLDVVPMGDWIPEVDGHIGVWPLSGEIDVFIPNYTEVCFWKEIVIQLVWKPAYLNDYSWDNRPLVGVTPSVDPYKVFTVSRTEELDDGWMYSLYEIEVIPNPLWEWIAIKGDILVDQLVIDTLCVPEPSSLALLGLCAIALLRRR